MIYEVSVLGYFLVMLPGLFSFRVLCSGCDGMLSKLGPSLTLIDGRAGCSPHSVARYFSGLWSSRPVNSISSAVAESEIPPIRWKTKKSIQKKKQPGLAELDWENLGFEYLPTNGHISSVHVKGKGWEAPKFVNDEYLKLHTASTALHYGQSCFEGLKAFHCKDGKIRVFRMKDSAERMRKSAARIMMAAPSNALFAKCVEEAVKVNAEFIPPYGSNGALYVRPLLFGSGPRIGLNPSSEYTLVVLVSPVGNYYKDGLKPVMAKVIEDYDRAAPKGVGAAKVAGNYAADILPNMQSRTEGYPISLYLDALTGSFVEEFSTSNFLGIKLPDKSGRQIYVTPSSGAILKSITNMSLMQVAQDMGLKVEKRPLPVPELLEGEFSEVAACGTAVILTAVKGIAFGDKVIEFGQHPDGVGPITRQLYETIRGIQTGDLPDKHGWMTEVSLDN